MAKSLQKQEGIHPVLLSFLLAALGAFAFLLPFMIVDKGFFLYCGDYNSQQIPFNTYLHDFIRAGEGTWSWATDLGSSAVNSYSFYNLGSPFFWLTIPFPGRWVPYMMPWILMLKFGCIGASACLFLKRYAKSRNMLVIVSVIYAMCGFNVYNIFFNHMLEPVIIFPLMLWAMDSFVLDRQRGMFAVMMGLSLLDNYFFFVGNVVFLLIYLFVKIFIGEYKLSLKELGLLFFEAFIGVGIGMVLFLPSFYNVIANPRTSSFAEGFGLIMYSNVQQYFAILSSMFLPPDPPYLPNIFTEGVIKWTSLSAYLPIVTVSGVIAYIRGRKWNGTKTLLIISLVMALVPILNSAFYAFNSSYYARWFYMPLLIAVLATLHSLEDSDVDLKFGAKVTVGITAVYIIFGLLPSEEDGVWSIGLAQKDAKFWLTYLTALLGAVLFYVLVRFFRGKVRFAPLLLSAVMGFSVFFAVTHVSLGKFPQWDKDSNYKELLYDGGQELTLPGGDFYRIDAYETFDNVGLWLDQSCLQTFNSVVNPTILEFYPMLGVKRDVSSKPEPDVYAVRGLLSVRYTLMEKEKRPEFEGEDLGGRGWTFLKEEGPYAVYENDNFIPLGFTYDSYIDMDVLESIYESDRAPMLVRAIGLTDEQQAEYGYLFEDEQTELYDSLGYEDYVTNCDARRAAAAYESEADASGFRVRIDMDEDDLVFFGVPYEAGFTATVNGAEAEVLKVSGGMMAVYAPAGDNEIVFTYETPGFRVGAAITFASLAVLVVYLWLVLMMRGRAVRRRYEGYEAAEKETGPYLPPSLPENLFDEEDED